MTALSEAELAEIQAREQAATPGPWQAGDGIFSKSILACGSTDTYSGPVWAAIARVELVEAQDSDGRMWYARGTAELNAAFIAHAREDIPALLATLAATKARLAEVERERDRFQALHFSYVKSAIESGNRDLQREQELTAERERNEALRGALAPDTMAVLERAKIDLADNLGEAYKLYMSGEKPKGYYRHVLARHNNYCKAIALIRAALALATPAKEMEP